MKCAHTSSHGIPLASAVGDKRVFYNTMMVFFCDDCGYPTAIDLSTFDPPLYPSMVDLIDPKPLDNGKLINPSQEPH